MKKLLLLGPPLLLIFLLAVYFYLSSTSNSTKIVSKNNQQKINSPRIGLTLLATDLGAPIEISSLPDKTDKRLFIADQAGKINILTDNEISKTPFLDISGKVTFAGEMGLLGLAFHPNFTTNGYFYVNYIDKSQNTVIARFQANNQSNSVDLASEKTLLKIAQPYTNHNGGNLTFGPDNYLYIAIGDGGAGGDPENRSQNLNNYFGKILRIDVDNGDPYLIPKNNPFVNQDGAKGEIWAYGLRNPWKFSFDSLTKDLWIADVGQGKLEEINFEKANSKGGANYGWRCFEGSSEFNSSGCKEKSSYVLPVIEYDHSEKRCSVTGGFVYRGTKYKALYGKYFYADYCSGQVYLAEKNGVNWVSKLAAATPYKISTFGQDSQGNIYLADLANSSIYLISDLAN